MSAETNDFLQQHSMKYLEMAFRTDRQGEMDQPDGHAGKTGDCGDTVDVFLAVRDNRVEKVSYVVNGCMNTNACANAIAELVEGKSIEEAWEITPEAVAAFLQTLPEDHFHCAELAVGAFYLALSDCRETKRRPWKKAYK